MDWQIVAHVMAHLHAHGVARWPLARECGWLEARYCIAPEDDKRRSRAAVMPSPADQYQASLSFRVRCFSQGGPQHTRWRTAAWSAGSLGCPAKVCTTLSRPALQRGQHNISTLATRRIKSAADSIALVSTTGMPNACRACAKRVVLHAEANSP